MSQPYGSLEEPGGSPAPSRKGLVAAITVAVLVLAVIGATTGWLIAGRVATKPVAGGTPSPSDSASGPSASEPPIAEPSEVPTVTVPSGGFALPDVRGTTFETARRRLRDLGLGVQLYFAASGDSTAVERTVPEAGQLVRRGITVKIYVTGRAPYATIPDVVGRRCADAGSLVAEHGLVPRYPNGRSGVVLRQDPAAEPNRLRWNDVVVLYCGAGSPSAAPGTSPSAAP